MLRIAIVIALVGKTWAETEETCADRATKAQTLLNALSATLSMPIEVRVDGENGLGVFAASDIPADTQILEVPHELWVKSAGGADNALPLALALESRKETSSTVIAAYLETLPAADECPANLATRGAADLALAEASMHG